MNSFLNIAGIIIGLALMVGACFGFTVQFNTLNTFLFGFYVLLTGLPFSISVRKVEKSV